MLSILKSLLTILEMPVSAGIYCSCNASSILRVFKHTLVSVSLCEPISPLSELSPIREIGKQQ